MTTINLNADMGESYGAWKMGADAEVMPFISSANIASGFHAGDPATIRKTVRLAVDRGVAVGAHPSLPDLQGFGRRAMKMSRSYASTAVHVSNPIAVSRSSQVWRGKSPSTWRSWWTSTDPSGCRSITA